MNKEKSGYFKDGKLLGFIDQSALITGLILGIVIGVLRGYIIF